MDIGQLAPDIQLPSDGGDMFRLSAQRGKIVVVYFYPKDATPGCTKQALGFRDALTEFQALNAVVVGISKDSVKKHSNFVAKEALTFPLLSDADGDVCERWGVWQEKSMYGKTYMGIERSTFVIDAHGKLAHAWRKVKVPGHVENVLDAVRSIARA